MGNESRRGIAKHYTTNPVLEFYWKKCRLKKNVSDALSCLLMFKAAPWDEIFSNFVNFENLVYLKLFSLLILTKNTKKIKKLFQSTEKEWNSYISRSYIAM